MKNRLNRSILAVVLIISLLFQQVSASAQGGNNTSSPQTGHSSTYDYLQYDTGSAGTLYVNQYTTKPHVRRSDLTLGGNRMPVEIEFWYDEENLSNDLTASANPYGYGWMTSYNQLLEYHSIDEQYAWRNANGTWIYFEDSEEVTADDASIWTEAATAEDALTGAVLYLEEDAVYTDYTAVTIEYNEQIYEFDAAGRLTSITDAYDNFLSVVYSNQSGPSILRVTDGVGRRYVFSYTNGLLNGIACQTGSGNPILVQNTPISVSYTIASGLLTETSLGAEYSYDSSHRITALWGQDGIGYAVAYNTGTQEVTSVTKKAAMDTLTPLTGTVTQISKSNNQVTITEGSLEQVQTYDNYGQPVNCEINELVTEGGITTPQLMYGIDYIYEEVLQQDGSYISQLTDIQFYDGTEQSGQRNGLLQGNIPEEDPAADPETGGDLEDPETEQEDYGTFTEVRDQYGNVISETNTVGGLSQTTLYTYSSDGNYLASVTNEDGIVTTYNFNSLSGILQSVTDGLNHTTSYSYNALRELTAASLPVSDLANNATGMNAAYTYSDGRISSVTYGSFVYTFTYDAWGNITQVLMGSSPLISYSYGAAADKGQVQSLTYGNGQQVFYGYNSKDQIISVGYTGQLNRFAYTYDEEGKLTSITDSISGQTTLYTEDGMELRDAEDGLLFSLEAGEDEGETLQNVLGNIWSVTQSSETDETSGETEDTLELKQGTNRLLSKTISRDVLGWGSESVMLAGDVWLAESRDYNNQNGNAGSLVSAYTFDVQDYYEETALHGEYYYDYDDNGNLIQEISSFIQIPVTPLDPDPDDPNPMDEIDIPRELMRGIGDLGPFPGLDPELWDLSGRTEYSYDEAGQLSFAETHGKSRYSYTYDASGNIVSSESRINTSTGLPLSWQTTNKSYTYNADGLLTAYDRTDPQGTTHTVYTLDAMGNPVSLTVGTDDPTAIPETKTLTWGEGRMLTGITTDASNYIHYTYNADGLRIQKTVCESGTEKETHYIWNDGRLIAEYDGTQAITVLYDSENSPVGFTVETGEAPNQSTATYIYLKNLQGDITHILDEDGETVVSYTYDPWGNTTVQGNTSIAAINPCSYRGYYYDEETGWYYLQSRYYDPEIGRFLNADEAERIENNSAALTSYNVFSYCENAPINQNDSHGMGIVQFVGWGFQIEISSYGFVYGMEAVWFSKGARKIGSYSRKAPYVYYYGIISFGYSLAKSSFKKVAANPSLLYNPRNILSGVSFSGCFFAIFGYNSFNTPKSYCGRFSGPYSTIKYIKTYVSTCKDCFSVGAGISSAFVSFGFSYTNYYLIGESFSWASGLSSIVYSKARTLKR